jgi:6-phosphogluconolactonase
MALYKYIIFLFALQCVHAQQKNYNLIVGTYTNSCQSNGIYVYNFDTENAEFKLKSSTNAIINPSFLTISDDKKHVYCVNENGNESKVTSFDYNSDSGNLQFLNTESSHGNDPCFIINDEKNVLVANYSGGSIAVFGKNENGSLTESKQIIKHEGKSVNAERQEKSHIHQLQFSPDGKYVFATDLGADLIYVYRYFPNRDEEVLEPVQVKKVKSGSGPRHLTFSKDGKNAYLVQELDGSLTVFKHHKGILEVIQETTLISKCFKGEISAADIHFSPDEKFIYATNRGDANTISCFERNEKGILKLVQTIKTQGKGPRNFAIDPTGNYLLVAHQYTNDIVIFKRDKIKGKLTDTKKRIELCSPVCLVFEE